MLPSLFWAFTAATLFVLAAFGRNVERGFALLIVFGLLATWLIHKPQGATNPILLLLIDSSILGASLVLALFSDRFWPIWFSGFHSLSVLTSVAHLVSADDVPSLFLNLSAFWFYPAVWCTTAGVILDWQARRAAVVI